tara:strand:- start:692 stop:1279 length:588 start_codon:yes stop_codon:yes gene_type:complete
MSYKNKDFEEVFPKSVKEWRSWLSQNHAKKESIWLVLPKKDSTLKGLTIQEAVDHAQCFGWIDSVPNKIDDQKYKILVSPRSFKSNWSRVNKEKIARLRKEDLITEPGYEMIRIAKENGTWDALNDVENLVIPPDLKSEFNNYKHSKTNFENFPRSAKRGILEWIFNAKRTETRKKRVEETAELAEKNIRANQFR